MLRIINNFITKEDVETVYNYVKEVNFHTKDNHVELHNNLFSSPETNFDIHTRGEMPDNILEIFSKYSKGFYEAVQGIESDEYHPPMFSKHYIARYRVGSSSRAHANTQKPEKTYKSFIFWNTPESGGTLIFPNLGLEFSPNPGDLFFFTEEHINASGISEIKSGNLFLSECWMGRIGQHFMENKVPYDEVPWDNWEIRGF